MAFAVVKVECKADLGGFAVEGRHEQGTVLEATFKSDCRTVQCAILPFHCARQFESTSRIEFAHCGGHPITWQSTHQRTEAPIVSMQGEIVVNSGRRQSDRSAHINGHVVEGHGTRAKAIKPFPRLNAQFDFRA